VEWSWRDSQVSAFVIGRNLYAMLITFNSAKIANISLDLTIFLLYHR